MQRRHALLALWVVVLAAFSARADDFYVDAVNGSDVSGDGSQANPWKTITFSLSQIPGPDDVLLVATGTYDTALGEVFPLRPQPHVSLISLEGAEVTEIVGQPNKETIVFPGAPQAAPSEPELIGFTLRGGRDAVVMREQIGERVVLTLKNNTITKNIRSGIYAGAGRWLQVVVASKNRITENRYGVFHQDAYPWLTNTPAGVTLSDNCIEFNSSDGVRIVDGEVNAQSTGDIIRNNGGVGWWQSTTQSVHTTLTNSTISGNAGGGLYTHADVQIFPGYYGYYYFDPSATINTFLSTIHNNSGFGGAMRAGTSLYVNGFLAQTISWSNTGLDNVNFDNTYCNIGTGERTGPGNISADPRFVDPQTGDFRIRRDSPCIDAGSLVGNHDDFEGQTRPWDGDSNGVSADDMGIDEFHTMVFPGVPAVRGQAFHFVAQAPPAEDGNLVTVLISGSRGGESGGIVLPGSGGQAVDLTADALFALGLGLAPLFNTTLAGGEGQTLALVIPNTPFTGDIFYAGVSIDLVAGQYVSITPTHSLEVQ